ncbi:MAG: transcription termination/antitermination NusG family protein [Oscillospiraceae bacterium]
MIYVVYVKPSAESGVCSKLLNSGFNAYAPTRTILERRGGKWHTAKKIVFPNYVFIDVNITDEIYYAVKKTDGVLRFLGKPPEPIRKSEVEHLNWIFELQNIGVSKGRIKDGKLIVTDGALVGRDNEIVDYDKHTMRGWIYSSINGNEYRFSVTIDIR